nr:hypothetical protein Iba_chr04dCG8850 [Ipomoea batatas]
MLSSSFLGNSELIVGADQGILLRRQWDSSVRRTAAACRRQAAIWNFATGGGRRWPASGGERQAVGVDGEHQAVIAGLRSHGVIPEPQKVVPVMMTLSPLLWHFWRDWNKNHVCVAPDDALAGEEDAAFPRIKTQSQSSILVDALKDFVNPTKE